MKKIRATLSIFLMLVIVLGTGHVVDAASKAAVDACKSNPQRNTTKSEAGKKSAKEACEAGYDAGLKGSDQANSCKKYNANRNDKKSCYWGYGSGEAVKKKTDAAKAKGKQGAESGKSKTNACKGLSGSAKTSCEQSYDDTKNPDANTSTSGAKASSAKGKNECGGVSTYFSFNCSGADKDKGGSDNPITSIILTIIGWLTALVSVAVVGAIVYGGILYMSARDNSGQVQKGITIIVDAVIGLILLVALFLIVNFIVPGGLFN